MSFRLVQVGLLSYAALMLGLQPAHSEYAFFPGLNCEPYGKPTAIRVSSSGGVVNSSASERQEVLCPLNVYKNSGETSITDPQVFSNSTELSCTVYARLAYGQRIAAGDLGNISSPGTGQWRYRLTVYRNFTLKYDWGYFYLDCTLPPGGLIYSYSFYQN